MMATRAHGTRAKYVVERCRCEPCKTANRQAENDRYRQQAYGRWQPYIDARPVRAHVQMLMDYGMGWKRIAAMAGVGRGTVEKLLYGAAHRGMEPSKRVRPETAAKLLAIRPEGDRLGGAVPVDSTGTHRRLQALVAAGWPQAQLAARLGMERANFGASMRSAKVLAATERAVRRLYDELWRADPRDHGVGNQAYSRARNHAVGRSWAPVGAWDDDTIDDPAAKPQTGTERPLNRDELAALRREEAKHLHDCGLSSHEIAVRLGISTDTVRAALVSDQAAA
ncbi:hypothetical protein ACFYM2_21330 [Streptomyces sp. NPDC006711]|uniref:hypothetical protein n=1 Tax=Streptomyces sp. NPDC006711 TaxID=3364762 RepID=UPI0036BFD37A